MFVNKRKAVVFDNYAEGEGDCKCGCKKAVGHKILILLQAFIYFLMRIYGTKIKHITSSGARCEKHNADEKGSKDSEHVKGNAFDGIFLKYNGQTWEQIPNKEIFEHAQKCGLFTGIGLHKYVKEKKNLVHLDCRDSKEVVIW